MDSEKIDNLLDLAADIAGKADVIEDILILYTVKDKSTPQALDNGIEVGSALYLMLAFQQYLIDCTRDRDRKKDA